MLVLHSLSKSKYRVRYSIKVKPNSKKGPLIEETAGGLVAYLQEPAVDGKANAALVKVLAKHFGTAKRNIKIIQGAKSKNKVVEVNRL